MITLKSGTQVSFTGAGLMMLLEDMEGKDIVIDQSGSAECLKFIAGVETGLTVAENGIRTLWFEGEDEDFYSIDVAGIKRYGKDLISGSIDVEMDNGMGIQIYQQ